MAVVVLLAFGIVLARLWTLQIREGSDFRRKSLNNFVQIERLEHERGEIVDRWGRVLVSNRPSMNVYVTPAFFPNATRNLFRLTDAVGVSRKQSRTLARALSKAVAEDGPPILLARDLGRPDVDRLDAVRTALELPWAAVPVLEGEEGLAAYVDPGHFPSTGLVLDRVAEIMRMSAEDRAALEHRVRTARGLERYQDILVRRDVPPEIEAPMALEVQLGALPGVTVRRALARDYRFGRTASHLLGYVNEVSLEDLEVRADLGYRLGDSIGRRGVEQAFEDELRGTDGKTAVVVDSKGRTQRSSLADSLRAELDAFVAPRPGNRVVLTLDLELQRIAEDRFDGRAGAVVVMEVDSGRILAMTSTPSFDPNKLVGHFDAKEQRRLRSIRARRPWRFRAIQDFFAPGSTFKVVTALAALETGAVRPRERIRCPGAYRLGRARFRCWRERGHGSVDLIHSLMWSCDVYYYNLGARLGLDAIARYGRALGLGTRTGISLGSESPGIMPDGAWYDANRPEGYTLGAAVNASIGQGAVSTTPLQLAVMYAAIANGGTVYRPRVARMIESPDGEVLRTIEPEVARRLEVDAENLQLIREGLRRVVNEPGGTAFGKRIRGFEVLGKTGTAQVAKLGEDRRKSRDVQWRLRDHAWFAAVAPAESPEIVVVVFNEHGGGGSSSAAPIAMEVVRGWRQTRARRTEQARAEPPRPFEIAVFDDPVPHGASP